MASLSKYYSTAVQVSYHYSQPCVICLYPPVYSNVEKFCVKYSRTKGPGTIARPERHPFFQKLGPMIKHSLDKSTRENGFM